MAHIAQRRCKIILKWNTVLRSCNVLRPQRSLRTSLAVWKSIRTGLYLPFFCTDGCKTRRAPSVIRRIYEDLNAWNEMEDSSEALSTIRATGRIYTVPTNIQWHLAASFHNQLESTNIRVSGFKALIGCLCALLKESQQTKDWPPSANLVDISTKSHNSTAAHTHMVWDIHCRLCGVLNGFEPLLR